MRYDALYNLSWEHGWWAVPNLVPSNSAKARRCNKTADLHLSMILLDDVLAHQAAREACAAEHRNIKFLHDLAIERYDRAK